MSRAEPIWHDLPLGMSIYHSEKGPEYKVYLGFRCSPWGQTNWKTAKHFAFNYDNYQEKYDEAINWIKANRDDYIEPRTPLTRAEMMKRLGLKKTKVTSYYLTFKD